MSEVYSLEERVIIFSSAALLSLIISFTYLFRRITCKKIKWYIFLICFLYSSAFIYLNILAMFDLIFNDRKGFEKCRKFISKFYEIFNYIDKALGFVIFPFLIAIFESGYISNWKKFFDGILGIICDFIQSVSYSFGIIFLFGIAILVLIIKYREYFGLGNDIRDYLYCILDCYSFYDIYKCVGFFCFQVFFDCQKCKKKNIKYKYLRYSIIKTIEKTDLYINKKMKDLYNNLKEQNLNNKNGKKSEDFILIEKTLHEVEEKLKIYESEGKKFKIMDNQNYNNDNNNNNNTIANINITNDLNSIKQINNNNQSEKDKNMNQNKELANSNNEKQKKLNPVEYRKKYKKYVRKIDKLKLVYKEINKDFEKEKKKPDNPQIENYNKKSCCKYCKYVILFVDFGLFVATDFILPITLNLDKDYLERNSKNEKKEDYKKEDTISSLIAALIVVYLLCLFTSGYTIITIYSTKRRRYISGDFLYDRSINDDLSLMKTVQIVCGFSFTIIYCNLFFWRSLDKAGVFGRPCFYDETFIPDYVFTNGFSVVMIVKIVIIVVSMFGYCCCDKKHPFKNDLAEFDKDMICDKHKYNSDDELIRIIKENPSIYSILNC